VISIACKPLAYAPYSSEQSVRERNARLRLERGIPIVRMRTALFENEQAYRAHYIHILKNAHSGIGKKNAHPKR
jgi:hypothetical protein